ncbi:MAG TPA: efflux RND transporter periplasmic adaptor subunit [Steroidobacteraceae bacterium]|nr:efflux RND transporter periplasmic adaptor subunit [Steroidobacteraceae bacterium]
MIRDTSQQDQLVARPALPAARRRQLLIAGAAALLVIGAVAIGRSWISSATSVSGDRLRIVAVTRGDLVRDIAAEGKVISANSPTLYAIAPGTVTLHVVAGDVVKKGQALADINSPELRSKLVQEESTLASLEAEASRAELDAKLAQSTSRKAVDQAVVERTAADRDLQRYQRGYDLGAVAQVDLMRAKDVLQKAEIGLAHAREDAVLQGQGGQLDARNKRLLAERQRAIVSEARRQVDALTLRAPFDGQVGQVQVTQYTNVALNAPVLGVVDLSSFEVEFKVPESFAKDLAIGMPAQITSGSGEPFAARISAVSPEVVAGEVTGRLRFSGPQPAGLRQSQRLNVRILEDTRRNVLMVERGPFVDQAGGRYAYVMDGSSAVRRPVQLGVSSLDAVEIIAGLKAGDQVVVSGTELFNDAPRVKVSR